MALGKRIRGMDHRTKIVIIVVIAFVVVMLFSYMRLYQKSKKIEKEQKQVEAQIKKEKEKKKELKEKKKELKEKKEYIKTKEFIEKMATEKFGLLYPGEYLLKGDE